MTTIAAGPNITITNILVATDLSAISEQALRAATGIAKRYRAELVIAHILEPTVPMADSYDGTDILDDQIRHHALAELARLETLTEGIHSSVTLREGAIWDELLKVIEERGIDFIVLGTHGASRWAKLSLGSIAEQIFRRASCPVLTVGPHVSADSAPTGDLRSIVYATDFSSQALEALPYALSMAAEHHAQLTLLHAIHKVKAHTPAERTIAYQFKKRLHEIVADNGGAAIAPDYRVAYGDPAEAILRAVKKTAADLIVLGVRRDSGFARFLPWSVASKIVRQALCPVLTIRKA